VQLRNGAANAPKQLRDVEQISFQFVSEHSVWNVWSSQLKHESIMRQSLPKIILKSTKSQSKIQLYNEKNRMQWNAAWKMPHGLKPPFGLIYFGVQIMTPTDMLLYSVYCIFHLQHQLLTVLVNRIYMVLFTIKCVLFYTPNTQSTSHPLNQTLGSAP